MKKNKYFIVLLVIFIGFMGYKLFLPNGIEQITTDELAVMMNNPDHEDSFYVDVREPHEFNAGHITEMSNVPLNQLKNNYEQIPKDKTVVIICQSGNRSLQAAKILEELGYPDIINVKGGMLAWNGEVTN